MFEDQPVLPEQRGIARRTLVKGAAWSLPAIAVAVAAPLASASTTTPQFDLTPSTLLPAANFAPNASKTAVIGLYEIKGAPTEGTITFTVSVTPGYTLSFDPSLTTAAPIGAPSRSVQNQFWVASYNADSTLVTFQSLPGYTISANGSSQIGLTVTRTTAAPGTSGTISVNVVSADQNPANNTYDRGIAAG